MAKKYLGYYLAVLCLALLLIPFNGHAAVNYEIRTVEDLANVSNDLAGNYTLMNDLDLSAYADWTPIGTGSGSGQSFSGIFDGQGYTISGVTMTGSGYSHSGLFGVVSGTVKNVNVEITLVDANSGGGLVGYLKDGTLTTSSSAGSVIGLNDLGGLVGMAENATIKNCYSTASVTSSSTTEGDGCGGLVGELYGGYNDAARVTSCYAAGKVTKTGTSGLGGIVGYMHGYGSSGRTSITASYYCISTTKMGDEKRGFGVTSPDMKKQATFLGWDFDNIWAIDTAINDGYPYLKLTGEYQTFDLAGAGTQGDPYIITTEEQLAAMARGELQSNYTAYYQLGNDIALTSSYWTPIGGNGMDVFSGVFDGNGHSITGLDIAFPGYTYEGLFGEVTGSIQNLHVEGTVSDAYTAGVLAGYLNGGTVTTSSSSGSVTGLNDLGGLVGLAENATIKNCYSTASVTSSSTTEGDGCGGLVGELYGGYNDAARITSCYAAGKVTKTGTSGLGGIVGYMHGYGSSGRTSITASYYCISTTKMGDEKRGFGVTSGVMRQQNTFLGWDFDNIWAIDAAINDGFPTLKLTGEYQTFELEGSGTSRDPYVIYTQEELAAVARGEITNSFTAHYQLGNDIALTSSYWTPIGGNGMDVFSGVFDGNGHSITGLDIAFPGYTYEGLFGEVTGSIQNLHVEGTISDAYTAGMLAGYLNGGTVTTTSSAGNIAGRNDLGGLVGMVENATLYNCYSIANIIGSSTVEADGCGGLVGELYGGYNDAARITSCYAAGKVVKTGASGRGGIVGYRHAYGSSGTTSITASYYDSTTTTMTDLHRGFPVDSAQMKVRETFANWDFNNIWAIDPAQNNGYPYLKLTGEYQTFELEGSGTSRDPYVIYTEEELAAVARGEITNSFTVYYQLANDIELTSSYWTPIGGNGMDVFSGVFDGNGYTVSGLKIAAQGYEKEGLFGEVTGTVKNLGVIGSISNASNAGLLTGYLEEGGIVEQCWTGGSVAGSGDLGGMIGYAVNAAISDCYSRADVSSTSADSGAGCGGLVGELYGGYNNEAKISRCYATGTVEKNGASGIGGLIGYAHTYGSSGATTVAGSYFDNFSDTATDKGTYKSTDEMKQQATYGDWDFATTWAIQGDTNDGYPYLANVPPGTVTVSNALTGITLEGPDNTTVTLGTTLNLAGLKVTAHYQDGTTSTVSSYALSGYDANTLGSQTITVSYQGKTATFQITVVAAEMTGIQITTKPTKRSYVAGETLNLDGMVVTAVYNNGTTGVVTGYTTSGFDSAKTGAQTVTVTYGGYSDSFSVTVSAAAATGSVSAPQFSITSFKGGKEVALTSPDGAPIYYTTDGAVPGSSSSLYTGPIRLTETTTLKAVAIQGGVSSTVTSGKISVSQAAAPASSHEAGELTAGTVITLRSATSGATIYYTTNGADPTAGSTLYTGSIVVNSSVTLKAVAMKDGYKTSEVFEVSYTVSGASQPEAGSAVISLGTVVAAAGDTVSIPVYIFPSVDASITDFRFTVTYDPTVFEYDSLTPVDGMKGSSLFASMEEGTVTLLYSDTAGIESGEMCTINLTALPSAKDGEYKILLVENGASVSAGSAMTVSPVDGLVKLSGSRNSQLTGEVAFTDANGNSIDSASDIQDVDAIQTSVNIHDAAADDSAPSMAKVILAVYDEDGAMVSVDMWEFDISDPDFLFIQTINIPKGVVVGSIKIMVVDQSMAPLMDVNEL